jgi:hypothetical protein
MKSKGSRKTTPRKVLLAKKRIRRGEAKNGALYAVAIVAVVATFGGIMAGGAVPQVQTLKNLPPPGNPYSCCDSGDGASCHPLTGAGQTITYNGDTYGLLKTNIVVNELQHYQPTNQYTPDGHRIFVGTSNVTADYSQIPGCEKGKDLIRVWPPGSNFQTRAGKTCYGMPHGELIYVCKDTQAICNTQVQTSTTPFDVYYRLKDGPVPTPLSTWCPKPSGATTANSQQMINVPTPADRKNLQLETFQVMQKQGPIEWDNQFCKPAINLYPKTITQVHVQVAPQGKLNYTNPTYPANGWDVTAYPDGTVIDHNKTYPYLYWEAAISDQFISQPKEGYVVPQQELASLFQTVLPKLGLNQREMDQFSSYWTKALPQSNYYFVGIVPQPQIDTIAPLTITPNPDTIIRVSLYFKALDQKISVTPPKLNSATQRSGFTVSEWGGFFKADKNHPNFTCLM